MIPASEGEGAAAMVTTVVSTGTLEEREKQQVFEAKWHFVEQMAHIQEQRRGDPRRGL